METAMKTLTNEQIDMVAGGPTGWKDGEAGANVGLFILDLVFAYKDSQARAGNLGYPHCYKVIR